MQFRVSCQHLCFVTLKTRSAHTLYFETESKQGGMGFGGGGGAIKENVASSFIKRSAV